MIHTATITFGSPNIDDRIPKSIFENFISHKKTQLVHETESKLKWVNLSLRQEGLTVIGIKYLTANYPWYQFLVRINFLRLIEKDNHIKLFSESSIAEVAETFDNVMQRAFGIGMIPSFLDFKVNRIDYCINVRTPYVKAYIALLKKSDKPYFMQLPKDKWGRETRTAGSVYYCGKSRNINIYDKLDQLVKEKEIKPRLITDEMLKNAENILRIEVQWKAKTSAHIRKLRQENPQCEIKKYLSNFLSDSDAIAALHECIKSVSKDAPFRTISQSQALIEQSNFRSSTKNRLLRHLLAIACKNNSIYKYRSELDDKAQTLYRDLKALESIGVNAVTIPEYMLRSRTGMISKDQFKTIRENGLPSLMTIANQAIDEEVRDVLQLWEVTDD